MKSCSSPLSVTSLLVLYVYSPAVLSSQFHPKCLARQPGLRGIIDAANFQDFTQSYAGIL